MTRQRVLPQLTIALLAACTRAAPVDAPAHATIADAGPNDAGAPAPLVVVDAAAVDAAASWTPPDKAAVDGPHELLLEPGRPIFYVTERGAARPRRLVALLHGMCGPPSYACGRWIGAGVDTGVMVCPTGNARCGESPVGPPSWEAPSWSELVTIMNDDLEKSIAKVAAKEKGAFTREGAVLGGYSRGAYAAAVIARLKKDRWPYLVLIEANVSLSAASLRAAGVRAVALVAGDQGTEIAGERATAAALEKDGFPARLFVMKNTGHLYSDDMEYVMHDALAFVLAH